MNEMETRIIDIDVDEMRKKLTSLKAIKVKQENQVNNIYDFPDKKLLDNKGYARIRIIKDELHNTDHVYMTTKKMLSQGKFKVMEENEVEISDPIEGTNIFTSLGLELVESIKKYRESYKFKNTLIEIDINEKSFCPFPYIEIETSTEEELQEVVELLGYTMKDTTSKTIYALIEEYNKKI